MSVYLSVIYLSVISVYQFWIPQNITLQFHNRRNFKMPCSPSSICRIFITKINHETEKDTLMVRPGPQLSFPQPQDPILSEHCLSQIGRHRNHRAVWSQQALICQWGLQRVQIRSHSFISHLPYLWYEVSHKSMLVIILWSAPKAVVAHLREQQFGNFLLWCKKKNEISILKLLLLLWQEAFVRDFDIKVTTVSLNSLNLADVL